ncbi:MAG TPA: RidA family protein [Candidatus Limnocylindrales bacterium]
MVEVVEVPGWSPPRPLNRAVRAGGLVFVSGHVPVDYAGDGATAGEDIAEQTRSVLNGVRAALAAAGCRMSDVVSTRVLLTDIADLNGMDAVYREFFPEPFPARTTAQVSALGRPEWRVEIDAIAVANGRE